MGKLVDSMAVTREKGETLCKWPSRDGVMTRRSMLGQRGYARDSSPMASRHANPLVLRPASLRINALGSLSLVSLSNDCSNALIMMHNLGSEQSYRRTA